MGNARSGSEDVRCGAEGRCSGTRNDRRVGDVARDEGRDVGRDEGRDLAGVPGRETTFMSS